MVNEGVDLLGRLEKSIDIKAPPEKVWELLASGPVSRMGGRLKP